MSTSQPTDDNSARLEQIVAYLDGELSPDDSAQVEKHLASDDGFRKELQSIDRAWSALDQLPSTVVDDSFLQTTMELVVDSAKREVAEKTQALPVIKRNIQLGKILTAIAALLLGILVARLVVTKANQTLVADLPVIYHLDVYSQVEDSNYLNMLNQRVAVSDWTITPEQLSDRQAQFQLVSANATRSDWLQEIPDEQRVALRANFNRFRGLPASEQQRLRTLYSEIQSSTESQQLQQTVIRYQQWLNNLPASEKYRLQELPPDQRARQVARILADSKKNEALNISIEELKIFWEQVQPHLKKFKEALESESSEEDRQRFRPMRADHNFKDLKHREAIRMIMFSEDFQRDIHPIVLEALPADAREQFEKLHPWEKSTQLSNWIGRAFRLQKNGWKMPVQSGDSFQQELEKFFVSELEPSEKERLLALPHDQMQQELERLYRGTAMPRSWREPPERGRHPPLNGGPPRGRPGEFRRDRHDGRPPPRDEHRRPGRPPNGRDRQGPPPRPSDR